MVAVRNWMEIALTDSYFLVICCSRFTCLILTVYRPMLQVNRNFPFNEWEIVLFFIDNSHLLHGLLSRQSVAIFSISSSFGVTYLSGSCSSGLVSSVSSFSARLLGDSFVFQQFYFDLSTGFLHFNLGIILLQVDLVLSSVFTNSKYCQQNLEVGTVIVFLK